MRVTKKTDLLLTRASRLFLTVTGSRLCASGVSAGNSVIDIKVASATFITYSAVRKEEDGARHNTYPPTRQAQS